MMGSMRNGWLLLALAALAGCGGDRTARKEPPAGGEPGPEPAVSAPGGETPGADAPKGAEAKPEATKPAARGAEKILPKTPAIREKAFVVPEASAEGWKPSSMPLAQLARKVDEAMAAAKGIGAKTDVYADLPEGSGRVTLYSRIQERGRYVVEYVHPKTRLSVNLLIGDGSRQTRREGGTWLPPSGIGASGAPSVAAWIESFPAQAFASTTDGYGAWTALAGGLGKAGFRVSVQETKLPVRGQPRTFYRLVADKTTARIEARFDGQRMLPVTIRVVRQMGPRQSKVMWTTAYSFGHRFDASLFRIPAVAASTP